MVLALRAYGRIHLLERLYPRLLPPGLLQEAEEHFLA